MTSFASRLVRYRTRFVDFYHRHQLMTNCASMGSLYGLGNVIQQTISHDYRLFVKKGSKEKKLSLLKDIHWITAGQMAFIGAFCLAPFLRYFYKVLDHFVVGTNTRTVVKKCIIDQGIGSSICVCIFYTSFSILEGKPKPQWFDELKAKGLNTWLTGWAFWPLVQSINFAFMPTHIRPTYVGFCSLIWAVILSFIKTETGKEVTVNQDAKAVD